jgi:peptidoglycan/LPS O-acetylase OafA/YrhL
MSPAIKRAAPSIASISRSTSCERAQVITPARNASIDGLRGLLASYVFLAHYGGYWGHPLPGSELAVDAFFIMSAYVLTPGWRGDYAQFMLRRLLRLWPVYAFALVVAALLFGRSLEWTDFAFYPLTVSRAVGYLDSPVWSLRVEMWAMVVFPLFVWGGKRPERALAVAILFLVANRFFDRVGFGALFVLGSYLVRYRFNFAPLNWAIPQWLGKISYSLYLTHWIVLDGCATFFPRFGGFLAVPLALVVGYLVWAGIERHSIELSRKAGSILSRAKMAIA